MPPSFFPNAIFGWAFVGLLAAFLGLASYADLKAAVIPKVVSLSTLIAGVLMGVIRGGWLGAQERPVWLLGSSGALTGAADGLLFALAGFLFGFVFFTALWMLGVAGGGDVKLFAGIAAWVGPKWALYVIIVSLVINAAIIVYLAFKAVVTGNRKALRSRPPGDNRPTVRLVTFALPLSLATLIVIGWKVQHELNLASDRPGPAVEGVRHAM
jgi:Flp pilus assembly protein protease CpaA